MLRGESASVKTLQGTIQALEKDKANLQERVQRLEDGLAAGSETTKPSGKTELNLWLIFVVAVLCKVSSKKKPILLPQILLFMFFAGDVVLDQLREDKETAESQVCILL